MGGDKQSEQYRDRSVRLLKVNKFVNQCHAQSDMTIQDLEGKIGRKLRLLGVNDVSNSSKYERQYNELGKGNRGTELVRTEMGCLLSNLSLALDEQKEYEKTKELERLEKKLAKQIDRMQKSLETAGTKQEGDKIE